MSLIRVLELNNAAPERDDIRKALEASDDQFLAQQQQTMKPQLLFAASWVAKNVQEPVILMGWAASGYRLLGAPILGMFILTSERLVFVRTDNKGNEEVAEYSRSDIFKPAKAGMFGLNKVQFQHKGQSHTLHRIHRSNADAIVNELTKQ